jgi:hypothetical protein
LNEESQRDDVQSPANIGAYFLLGGVTYSWGLDAGYHVQIRLNIARSSWRPTRDIHLFSSTNFVRDAQVVSASWNPGVHISLNSLSHTSVMPPMPPSQCSDTRNPEINLVGSAVHIVKNGCSGNRGRHRPMPTSRDWNY